MNLFKNFVITVKRYTNSAVLNVFGLSLAFAACIVLMIQVNYEYGFDSYNKDASRCFRVARISPNDSSRMAYWSQPLIDKLMAVSPHIQSATMLDDLKWSKNQYIVVPSANNGEDTYKVDMSQVYSGFIDIAALTVIEGDAMDALSKPYTYLIPQSVAKKIYGDESPVGKPFKWKEYKTMRECTVGAVYKDIPDNSIFRNMFYYARPGDVKFGSNQNNFEFLVKLDNAQSVEDVKNQFYKTIESANKKPFDTYFTSFDNMYYDTTVDGDLGEKGNKTNTKIMIAIALLILIIATINYINFASALTPLKMRMMNVQRIIGADRLGQRFSVIIESVLFALISFIVAIVIVELLGTTSFSDNWIANISLAGNFPVVLLTAVMAIVVGVVAGIYPAYYMTSVKPALALKGSFGMSVKGRTYRSVLVGFQYIISFILIICTLFINLQNRYVNNYNLGYDRDNIIVVNISTDVYTQHVALANEIKKYGEIEDVAFAESKIGDRENYQGWGMSLNNEDCDFNVMNVSYNFLDVIGIPVTEGRNFRQSDTSLNYSPMIFNRITPKLNGNPLKLDDGQIDDNSRYAWSNMKVIGFMPDGIVFQNLRLPEHSFCFICIKNYTYDYMYIRVMKGANMQTAINDIKSAFKKIVPAFPVEIEFMDQQINQLYTKEQRTGYITTASSLLAILISLVGVFGLVLFETQYRRKEIGIRRVHGASVNSILGMFNIKFIRIATICFAVTIPVSWYIVKEWLTRFEYKIPVYWWVFAAAFLIVIFITIVTVTVRSWKTANANPAESVKIE